MTHPLHPALFRYLRSVQTSDHVGIHSFLRHHPERARSTVYRWQRSLGDHLLVVPNVRVEGLGLQHAHVFVRKPSEDWLSFPYAVEAAWVTPDFCQEVLYLHCLVPQALDVERMCESLRCARHTMTTSQSGWQQFLQSDEEIVVPLSKQLPNTDVLRRAPFIVPALMELWQYPNTLPLAWARIHQRLGANVERFLPRTKVRTVNGKTHITDAFHVLDRELLLRQNIIRYHPLLAASVEVFLSVRMEREDLRALLTGLRPVLHAVETYPAEQSYWCRLLGPHQLLDAIINLPAKTRSRCSNIYFHTKRHPTPVVRFQYERIFDPTTAQWTVAA